MNTHKGLAPIILVLMVLIAATVLADGFAAYKRTTYRDNSSTGRSLGKTGAWRTYQNERYGFAVRYPADFSLDRGADVPSDTCVLLKARANLQDQILFSGPDNNAAAHGGCGMTTGRGAFDRESTGELLIGTTTYHARGYAGADYEELGVQFPTGVGVDYWVNKEVPQFEQRRSVIRTILSTFRFTK